MKNISHYIAVGIYIIVLVGCATTAQKGAISAAYSAMDNGKYELALKKLSNAESYVEPTSDLKSEILYLRATCYEGLKKYNEAMGTLKYLINKFPNTSYAFQAKEKLQKLKQLRTEQN